MYGYIYLTTNLINNRKYIGQHKSEKFDKKYRGSGQILKQAFDKYGKDNFETIIAIFITNGKENKLIKNEDEIPKGWTKGMTRHKN